MDSFVLKGTGVALVTPFQADLSIDFQGLTDLVNHCIDGGVDYLVVMGTTGENPTLSAEEQTQVLEHVKKVNASRKPIVYGIGGNNTNALVEKLKSFNADGVTAILSVSPYYNKPTQAAIYHHYQSLSLASPKPIILYNVPGRTGSNITTSTCLQLAYDFSNIIGIKEASGNLEQVMEIIEARPEGFLVISGDDNLSLPILALGGDGVISVSGQGFPKEFSSLVKAGLKGDFVEARTHHYQLFEITKMLFAEGNPGGIKAVLKEKGICEEHMRQPLWPISEELREDLKNEMQLKGI